MKKFVVTAKVLHMEFGERLTIRLISALDVEDAKQKFIEKFLTIEILEVVEVI